MNQSSASTLAQVDDHTDQAVHGPAARAQYVAGGAALDGRGVRVGIVSDSFDALGGAAADVASGDLPAGVIVTSDSVGTDEGRAMAEIIHSIAPGATLQFYDAGGTTASVATALGALTADGCSVIVDDQFSPGEPFFQPGTAWDVAVQAAIGRGVSYFTAAGNSGADYYEHAFTPGAATTTLPNGLQTAAANIFGNGTALQSLTIAAGAAITLDLQWDQPFASISGTGSANSLAMYLFDAATGALVASATDDVTGGDPVQLLRFHNGSAGGSTQFQLAIVQNGGAAAPGRFKYIAVDGGVTINDAAAGTGSGDVFGHADLRGVNTVGAVDWRSAAAPVTEAFSSRGPGELLFDSAGHRTTPAPGNGVTFAAPDGSATSVGTLSPFYGTSAAAAAAAGVAALMRQIDPALTPADITRILQASAVPAGPSAGAGAGLIQADRAAALAEAALACFTRGTRILTPGGEVPIERLRPGDRVVSLLDGRLAAIVWIGRRRIDLARHARPELAWPVRVRAGAFGPGAPSRDVVLSPQHAVLVGGVLIPVRHLLTGQSVRQERWPAVEYLHLELDRHGVVLADGLAAESWLDTGNRSMFENAAVTELHPDMTDARAVWADRGCCPLVQDGMLLEAALAHLAATEADAATELSHRRHGGLAMTGHALRGPGDRL